MAYITNKRPIAEIGRNYSFKVGDVVRTRRIVDCFSGYFEKGTVVTVIGVSKRGYDLQDADGNRIIETGFDSIERIEG